MGTVTPLDEQAAISATAAPVAKNCRHPLPAAGAVSTGERRGNRLLAEHLLLELPALLRFDGERGGRARQQARQSDRIAGLLAVAVAAIVDARESLVDLLHQLAFPIAGAQLQRMLFFDGRAVGRIGDHVVFT